MCSIKIFGNMRGETTMTGKLTQNDMRVVIIPAKSQEEIKQAYLKDPQKKMWYDLGNGHALMVQAANRGLKDDFLVEFYEDCKLLDSEYATAEVVRDFYGVDIED